MKREPDVAAGSSPAVNGRTPARISCRAAILAGVWLAAALLLPSCSSAPSDPDMAGKGGGDDFPNSNTLGKRLVSGVAQYRNWGDSLGLDAAMPPIATNAGVAVPGSAPGGLSKSRAARFLYDSTRIDLRDTALGFIRVYHLRIDDSSIVTDTTVGRYDLTWKDTIADNEHIVSMSGRTTKKLGFQVETYRVGDADGDGIINNPSAPRMRAWLYYTKTQGRTSHVGILVDAGPDKNFDTEADNKIVASGAMVTIAGDTTEYAAFTDADGDSVVLDYAKKKDSCLVDVVYAKKELLTSSRVAARFVVFPSDSNRNYPIRLASSAKNVLGRVTTATIFGERTDSCFYPGDRGYATIVTTPALLDTMQTDTVRLGFRLGPLPHKKTDDSLLSVHAHTVRTYGLERETVISFASARPIPYGQEPTAGTLVFGVTYERREWIELRGSFTPESIVADYTDSKGNSLHLAWDRQGNPIEEAKR